MKFLTFPLMALSLSFHVMTSAQPYGQGLDFLTPEKYSSLPVAPRYRSFLPASVDYREQVSKEAMDDTLVSELLETL